MLSFFIRFQTTKPAFPDMVDNVNVLEADSSRPYSVVILDKGMESGKPSISIRTHTIDGPVVLTEMSAVQLVSLARVVMSKYPNLME